MLVSGITGGSRGAPVTEEAEEGMELEEDAVEIAEGDADADGGDVECAWFDGPAPLRLRIGMELMISSSPSS